jgi:hypothetical protein
LDAEEDVLEVTDVDVADEDGAEVNEGSTFQPMSAAAWTVVASFTSRSWTTHDLTSSLGADAYDSVAPASTLDAQFPTTKPGVELAR